MARITVNTTGTQPVLTVSTDVGNVTTDPLSVICLQDVTITNSTGIYTYTDFCDTDSKKITSPADNEITTNIVIDDEVFFGNSSATANSAPFRGIAGLSGDKVEISWKLNLNGTGTDAYFYTGTGYISGIAPTVSPDAPVWVSPLTIAVDGAMTRGQES